MVGNQGPPVVGVVFALQHPSAIQHIANANKALFQKVITIANRCVFLVVQVNTDVDALHMFGVPSYKRYFCEATFFGDKRVPITEIET